MSLQKNLHKAFVEQEQNRIKMISQAFESNDILEKGVVESAFRYSSTPLNFEKTGAEIKAKLIEKAQQAQVRELDYKAKIEAFLVECEEKPTEPYTNYACQEMGIDCSGYMTFSYESKNEAISSISLNPNPSVSRDQKIYNYRRLLDGLFDAKVEQAYCSSIARNISEKKSYPLTFNQITALGF